MAIIVCNMSVILPAILRALDVGDPFMQEDTVDPNFSAVEIARMASTRLEPVELSIPKVHDTTITNSHESEEVTGAVAFQQRDSVDLIVKEGLLTTHTSDVSPEHSKAALLTDESDESDITDSLAQVRNLPLVGGDQDTVDEKVKGGST